MSIAGFIVGLPVFCDSGYIVMSGLNQSLAKRTGISVVTMAVSLATGLYSCSLPDPSSSRRNSSCSNHWS